MIFLYINVLSGEDTGFNEPAVRPEIRTCTTRGENLTRPSDVHMPLSIFCTLN